MAARLEMTRQFEDGPTSPYRHLGSDGCGSDPQRNGVSHTRFRAVTIRRIGALLVGSHHLRMVQAIFAEVCQRATRDSGMEVGLNLLEDSARRANP